MEIAFEVAKRRADVGRVLHQEPDEPEMGQASLLTQQKAEMLAAGLDRTQAQQATASAIRDEIVRIIQESRGQSRFRQQLGVIDSKAP